MMITRAGIDWDQAKRQVAASQAALEGNSRPADAVHREQVYRQRARQLAAVSKAAAAPADAEAALSFTVAGERFYLELRWLVEVLPCTGCASLPGTGPELLGVVNVRGRICSVLDVARILELPALLSRPLGYVVLVRHAGIDVGLKVDGVEQIETISPEELDESAGDTASVRTRVLRTRTGGRAAVMNIEAIFSRFILNRASDARATQFNAQTLGGDAGP